MKYRSMRGLGPQLGPTSLILPRIKTIPKMMKRRRGEATWLETAPKRSSRPLVIRPRRGRVKAKPRPIPTPTGRPTAGGVPEQAS